jgi:DNA-binding PadR family transcriptional regulator
LSHLVDRDSYGSEIHKSIHEKTNQQYELKEATLYSAFRRLEQAGFIQSYWCDQETGARRRCYRITPAGHSLYRTNKVDWESAKTLIDKLI